MHEFNRAWAQFAPKGGPNILKGDEALLRAKRKDTVEGYFVQYQDWASLVNDADFGRRDKRLHLSLLPQPFFGDLSSATIFVLALNPGLHWSDYYAEFCDPDYPQAAANALKHVFNEERFPLPWFNPRFSWHPGFLYWHNRFVEVIDRFARTRRSRMEALSCVAILQLMPYHSFAFGIPDGIFERLRSVDLARRYVHEELAPRARKGEALITVLRGRKRWGLETRAKNIIVNDLNPRGMYITAEMKEAILTHLHDRWPRAFTAGVGAIA